MILLAIKTKLLTAERFKNYPVYALQMWGQRCPCIACCSLYMSGDAIHEDIFFCLTIPEHATAHGAVQCAAWPYWPKTVSMGLNGGFLHRWGSIYGGTERGHMHSSYECLPLSYRRIVCYTESIVLKRAEQRSQKYAAAGNFDCKLHKTTSTARPPVRKTMWRHGIRAWQCSISHGGLVIIEERWKDFSHWERNCCHSQWM
jgi:hypothetical protein